MIARPTKVYDFTAHARRQPTAPPPGDRLDAQLANHADAITAVQMAVERLAQTAPTQVDVKALAADIKRYAEAEFGDLHRQAQNAGVVIDQARLELARVKADADRAREAADRAEARLAAVIEKAAQAPILQAQTGLPSNTLPTPILGPNTGGFYAGDDKGATATAADYAQVAIDWAEHMPDVIPNQTMAINAISGDHWSSRWWANRSANAFGMLAWWYMGAWPGPPPSTPLTPTGQPIPDGGMYFDTNLGMMLVWNGSSWVPLAQGPAKATTSSLYYLATAGQTVFPLSAADRFGHVFAFNQTATEGLQALVNGVRLEPTIDFTVDTAASAITFLRPLTVNAIVAFDILTPTTQLTPSGTVNTVLLSPIVPDGVKTTFTGLTVAANGGAVNVAKNEELHVSVDGIVQQPGAAYNANAAAITFAEAPPANANVFIVWFGPGGATGAQTPPIVAPPAAASWAQKNFVGTTSLADVANGVLLKETLFQNSDALRMVSLAVPTTPYTIDAVFSFFCQSTGTNTLEFGWSDGTKYQIHSFGLASGVKTVYVVTWSSPTTAVSNLALSKLAFVENNIYARISDDGTNVTFSISLDGVAFVTHYTSTKAAGYLGASGYTNVVWGLDTNTGGGASPPPACMVTLKSWWVH